MISCENASQCQEIAAAQEEIAVVLILIVTAAVILLIAGQIAYDHYRTDTNDDD